MKAIVLYVTGLIGTFLTWWLLSVNIANRFILPSPFSVFEILSDEWLRYFKIALCTLKFASVGLAISAVIAVLIGFVSAIWKQFDALYPLLVTVKATPAVVIAPILSTAIGSGFWVKALVASTISLFPVVIATIEGLRDMPEDLAKLEHVYGATRFKMFSKVGYAYMLNGWLAGLQSGAPLAVVGSIVAEFVDPSSLHDGGIGLDIAISKNNGQVERMFASSLCAALIGISFFYLALVITRIFQRRFKLGK